MTTYSGINEYQTAPASAFYTGWVGDAHSTKERELDRQSHDLARQFAKTENRDEREKLRDKLNDTLKQQFDAQQQRRKDEIKQIEDQLKKLRDLMQKREDSKSSIVQRRLEQLLQEADGLGWTSSEPLLPRAPQAIPPATSKAPTPKR
jgi:mevalonate kinase